MNRDLRPDRDGRLSSRITIRVAMPSVVSVPTSSVKSSYGSQPPSTGSTNSASNSWKKAVSRVRPRVKKPTATNQCAMPTTPQRFILVWPTNSTATVFTRWAGTPNLVGSD